MSMTNSTIINSPFGFVRNEHDYNNKSELPAVILPQIPQKMRAVEN